MENFSCQECKKIFNRVDKLQEHRRSYHMKIDQHICKHCGKIFSRKDALQRHLKNSCLSISQQKRSSVIVYAPATMKTTAGIDVAIPSTSGIAVAIPSTSGIKRPRITSVPPSDVDKKICLRCNICKLNFETRAKYSGHMKSLIHIQNTSSPHLGDYITASNKAAFKNRIVTLNVNNVIKENIDVVSFLRKNMFMMMHLIQQLLDEHQSLKVGLELYATYLKQTDIGDRIELKSFATKFQIITLSTDLVEAFNKYSGKLIKDAETFLQAGSGWTLITTSYLSIHSNKYTPFKIGTFVQLPNDLRVTQATINFNTNDNACFFHSVAAGLHPVERNANHISSYPNYTEIFNLTNISIPITFKEIPKFELQNDVSINVYGIEYCSRAKRNVVNGPLHFTKNRNARHINLLFIEDGDKKHFCLIKNMSRLISKQISKHNGAIFLCDGCLLTFSNEIKYLAHISHDCNKVSTTLPSSTNSIKNRWGNIVPENLLEFTDYNAQMTHPFCIYADMETMLIPTHTVQPNPDKSFTQQTTIHKPYSFTYLIVCDFDSSLNKLVQYTGLDCCSVFINRLTEDCKQLYNNHLKVVLPMKDLTPDQLSDFETSSICHICNRFISGSDIKVRDHNHLNGEFVGAAHSNCNLNYKLPTFFPVFFHNLSGYDSHLFIRELALNAEYPIDVIPQTMEKYISFSKTILIDKRPDVMGHFNRDVFVKLRFLDSLKFMPSSLDKLSRNLTKNQLVNVRKYFSNDYEFQLLCRKGVFPYSYIKDYSTLLETELPTKDKFFNDLSGKDISDEDYEHAKNVWSTFSCETLRDYSEVYLVTDVLLLADVFEAFRKVCRSIYKLDPAHFFTAPSLSWSAMLKFTGVRLQLLTDIDQHNFIRRGIRGGLCTCTKRHAATNNKYMSTFNKNQTTSFLAYWDANNLYGWAMSQYLPYGGFEWMSDEEVQDLDVTNISDDSDIGYILEVDIQYPQALHDMHNDLPFLAQNSIPPNSEYNHCKLIADLNNKNKYIIHYRNLRQCLQHGLVLTHIHRVLKFKQSDFISKYIALNTNHRQLAANEFEKDFYKLMNNSLFGKTMENIDKRSVIKLVNRWHDVGKMRGAGSLIAKPNFKRSVIFDENLVGIHLDRVKVFYNKPTYIGFAVLELSKLLMYQFHYDFIKPLYGDNATLCYSDTDSFILHIETDDLYEDMKMHADKFDTSNFPINNPYNIIPQHKAIPGLMKDENGGRVMEEFVGLRAKMYAYRPDKNDSWCKKAKGVKRCVVENDIEGDDYKRCLFDNNLIYKRQNLFRSIKHTIVSVEQNKLALSPNDDKRFIMEDGIHTLAWGNYKIQPNDINQ